MVITPSTSGRRVGCLCVLFLVFLLGIEATFLARGYMETVEDAEAASRDLAALVAEHVGRTLDASDLIADTILDHLLRQGGPEAVRDDFAAQQFLAGMAAKLPLSGIITVFDSNGRLVLASDRHPASTLAVDAGDRAWFRAHAVSNLDRYVGEAVRGKASGEILFTFSRRIADRTGAFQGVLVLALRPAFFGDTLFQRYFGNGTALAIFGHDARVIARRPFPESVLGRSAAGERMFADPEFAGATEGTYWASSRLDGGTRVASFRRLDRWPVIAAGALGASDVFARWTGTVYWSCALVLLALLGAAPVGWLALRAATRERQTRFALEQALQDKDVLFCEVHHRVKNNLQVTMGLLQMQARRFDDAAVRAAFEEVRRQLSSISLVHEELYRTDSASTVELGEVMRRLLPALASSHAAEQRKIGISLEGGSCMVDLEQAIPITLIVTEVVTNAFKHAFNNRAEGILQVVVDGREGLCCVLVRDDGPGITVAGTDRRSLGMKLVDALAKQLGATYTFANDRGTVFRIEFSCGLKAARLVPSGEAV